ncbi:RNA binding motif, single stranded interacting protein 3 [Aspergillus nanangensis]|uniref:RNA binding motif, single stranded interacting protein 3 n=1 Tax=Aspergillus nanangensis TaxID=2582783 RepID=A0AAD4CG48_ASPNN|nr:RNA binding motif, single stranded interacting protein 3 [Aspergillus nanangensis]
MPHHPTSETGQTIAAQPGHFAHDARTGMAPIFGALNMQNHRSGRKYGSIELAGPQRGPYQSPLVIPPMFLPLSPFPPTAVPTTEQVGQMPYLPTSLYPSPGMCPPTVQGYPLPYLMNAHEEQKPVVSATHDSGNHAEYYGSGLSNYPLNTLAQLGPALPLQMMKSTNGYILQDLESLTQQDPHIPRAVPAMWTNPSELNLAKCLENREGITNVYIRGFLPETTDDMLHAYASRFGKIDRCKAIVDLDTGLCKGFGFVQYFNFESCENCIRGFYYLGYQASFAQKSRNSRLKDLEDKNSTNIYCTNLPIDWTEADLRRHFEPFRVVSEKISRAEKTGVSKEVGFARFETREIAEKVLSDFHNLVGNDGVKLLLRFADTKAQKLLKQQSNERRAYRAGEYNYSVEVVQGGSTPSPSLNHLQQATSHFSPNSQSSYVSPVGVTSTWTPATTISPSSRYPLVKNQPGNMRLNSWSAKNSPGGPENTPLYRGRLSTNRPGWADNTSGGSKLGLVGAPCGGLRSGPTSPRKENLKADSLSPVSSRKSIRVHSPRSVV